MILTLLVLTFAIALGVTTLVIFLFNQPVLSILQRVVPTEISGAWAKYLRFAIYVVGIASGVRVWDFEKYITAQQPYSQIVELTLDRWVLEIYQTVIGTLQGTAMVLLVFFVFGLVAVVIVRVFEMRPTPAEPKTKTI
jgi:hypothetical protein